MLCQGRLVTRVSDEGGSRIEGSISRFRSRSQSTEAISDVSQLGDGSSRLCCLASFFDLLLSEIQFLLEVVDVLLKLLGGNLS